MLCIAAQSPVQDAQHAQAPAGRQNLPAWPVNSFAPPGLQISRALVPWVRGKHRRFTHG